MKFSAEVIIPDNLFRLEFINELRIKGIYSVSFADCVRVEINNATPQQSDYIIGLFDKLPNPDGQNKLSVSFNRP